MDTYIHFILDRSGSMWETMSDTIGGFNSFLNSMNDSPLFFDGWQSA